MGTSKIIKTMPTEWREFFKYARSQHWKKYFPDDGNETCAYNSEWKDTNIIQAAIRRQRGKTQDYVTNLQRKVFSEIFKKDNFSVNVIYVTCSYKYGGIYIYDETEIYEKKGREIDTKPRGVNEYYLVDVNLCHKMMNLWEIPKKCGPRVVYAVARNQYEHMLKDDAYANVKTWENLPDYCLWKFMTPEGEVIPGREEAYNKYIDSCKSKDGFRDPEYRS